MTNAGIVVVGAGGHAKVCIELLRAMGERVSWCISSPGGPTTCLGVDVLYGDDHLGKLREEGFARAFIAIGANKVRQRLADTVSGLGYDLVTAVSPSATVSPTARIGKGVAIMAGVTINADATISDLAIINTSASVDHDCVVGLAAHIAPQSGLAGNVIVGPRAFIGIGGSVIPNVKIGADVRVGAGAVVVRDVPAGTTAVGIPARILSPEEPNKGGE